MLQCAAGGPPVLFLVEIADRVPTLLILLGGGGCGLADHDTLLFERVDTPDVEPVEH